MLKKIIAIAITGLSVIALLLTGCGNAATTAPAAGSQPLVVTRGPFSIVVSTNGNLTMPNNFALRFGTMGKVKDILVKEGDVVKQGAMLAFLDNTTQKNAIKIALFNLKAAISNVADYSRVLTIPQYNFDITTIIPPNPPPYPFNHDQYMAYKLSYEAYLQEVQSHFVGNFNVCEADVINKYPDLSAPRMAEEAEAALKAFIDKYNRGLNKDAGADLASAYLYIEICEDLIKSKTDPEIIAGAKNNPAYAVEYTPGTEEFSQETGRDELYEYTEALDYLRAFKIRLLDISGMVMSGQAEKVKNAADSAWHDMQTVNELVGNTVNLKGWDFLKFTDIPTSLNFLQASMRSLDELEEYSSQTDARADKISQMLYLAKLNLSTSRNVLENQDITYWGHQFTWQSLQQYNLNVQTAEIALKKAMRDILNTVIVAPSDGTVVSVGLKKDYVLSAQDYSSRAAVELVDTKSIKFTGMVDEIDILKVKKGEKATITVDAVPGKIFTGRVKFISPYGTKVGNVVKFAITIELDPTDVELRGGLSASADIEIYTASNALLVPILALSAGPDGYTVNVIVDEKTGRTETRKVTIGRQNFQFAEVLSGLNEGEKVQPANNKPTALRTGFGPGGR